MIKVSAMAVPLALVLLIFGAVVAIGTMSVKSASLSTRASIELLDMHGAVVQAHNELLNASHKATNQSVQEAVEDAGDAPAAPAVEPAPAVTAQAAVPTGGTNAPDFLLVRDE